MSAKARRTDRDRASLDEAWRIFGPLHVPYRILMIGKALDRVTTHQVRESADISLAEWRVMVHLGRLGEFSAIRLSTAAQVDRSEVSRAVAALTARGLVGARPNPANRRSKLLSLTPEGEAVFERLFAGRQALFRRLIADLGEDELLRLDKQLHRIAQRIDEIGDEIDSAES